MLSKISIAAAVALVAVLAAPNASFAAVKKHKSQSAPNSASECLGGGCTGVNPDRVTQPCNGSNCYKRSKTKKTTSEK